MPATLETSFSLSILDQSPIAEGSTAGQALRNSIDLARLGEELGYRRYWVAEHHGTPALACYSPEVLIGPIASATSTIRVGSGGIMLPHYSPLKVAENFSMLSGLYPGRIDLGIGRAAGTSPKIALALQRDRRQLAPDDFPDQLAELQGYFEGSSTGLFLPSIAFASPETWLLGSSLQSAIWAAELGLPYVFADFINADGAGIAQHYRRAFQPSAKWPEPHVGVAAWTLCAPTDEEALRLSFSWRMMMILLLRGRMGQVPPVDRAERFLRDEGIPLDLLPAGRRAITGSPDRVHREVEALAAAYQADEVFLVNIMYDHQARRRSYELVAEAFGMNAAAASSTNAGSMGWR